MKKKYIIFSLCILLFIIIFIKITYKNLNIVNNINKSDQIDILNISEFEAIVEVEVNSNKNVNKYLLKQHYCKPNIFEQEVVEPENIRGFKVIFDGVNLTLENTKINLKTVYENYNYMQNSTLSLIYFIESYKQMENTEIEELENEIVMKIKLNGDNKYKAYEKLYIDKKTNLPTKMEILDLNNNRVVYILYKEIKIN